MEEETAEFLPFKKNRLCTKRRGGNSGIPAPPKESTLSYTCEGNDRIHALQKESALSYTWGGNSGIHSPQNENILSYTWERKRRNSCPSKTNTSSVLYVDEGTAQFMPSKRNSLSPRHGGGNSGIHALQKESTLSYPWVKEHALKKNPLCCNRWRENSGIHAPQIESTLPKRGV